MAEKVLYFKIHPPGRQLEDDDIEGGMPDEYIEFAIIRTMGWDWWTFHRQPDFFIDMIKAFIWAEEQARANIKGGEK